jgi:predicted small lipoprotein YifL
MRTICTICLALLLAGCGMKGDLYLPEAEPASSNETQ